jgi:hypothetical protein
MQDINSPPVSKTADFTIIGSRMGDSGSSRKGGIEERGIQVVGSLNGQFS